MTKTTRPTMRYSAFRRHAYLSCLCLAVALLYFFSLPESSNNHRLPNSHELEALKRKVDQLYKQHGLPFNNTVQQNTIDHDKVSYAHHFDKKEDSKVPSKLDKRVLFEYRKSANRGKALLEYVNDPSCAPPTPWSTINQLQDWGWSQKVRTSDDDIQNILKTFATPLESVGLNLDGGTNQDWKWSHDSSSQHGGVTYPPTGGNYGNVFNPSGGAIMAYSNFGPAYHVQNKMRPHGAAFPVGAPMPKLQKWSDVVAITWENLNAGHPVQMKGLKYVFRLNIINDGTNNILQEALEKTGVKHGQPPKWPGHKLTLPQTSNPLNSMKTAFQAMMGTPNCLGVAWLLFQHADILGKKKIESITVWDCGEYSHGRLFRACIMMEIADA